MGLGARALTPAASEVTSIAGVQTSFAQSAEVTLRKLCGLRLSESTVERVTEAAGERVANLLEDRRTFGEKKSWPWQRDARGKTCAYVGLDATGVRQQGQSGTRADGRMAYVGMVYNPRSEIRRMDEVRPTLVRRGASLGANCTIVCGVTIGSYAFVSAGAVVLRDVPDFGLVVGNPGRLIGWMCACGVRLRQNGEGDLEACPACGRGYRKIGEKVWAEEQ